MMAAAVLQTNPTPLVTGVRALGIDDIKHDVIIAAYDGMTWRIFKVVSAPYQPKPKTWWATMTHLAKDSSNDTLPRNLANLGIVQDAYGAWVIRRVTIHAIDLPQLEKARWSYDTPFLF